MKNRLKQLRKTISDNRNALQSLETMVATAVNNFTGQIMGLETAMQAMTSSCNELAQRRMDPVTSVLQDHEQVLQMCLRSCTNGLEEASTVAGTKVKYAKTFDNAKQVIGTMGTVVGTQQSTIVEHAEARGQSRQFVGNMSGDVADKFWG